MVKMSTSNYGVESKAPQKVRENKTPKQKGEA